MRKLTEQDFWLRVNKLSTGCWEWTGLLNPQGYGCFHWQGKPVLAHRFSLSLTSNITDKLVCHHCDNPRCVNPAHLYAGTAQTNSKDAKDRNRLWSAPGSKNPYSKLTESEVLDIRALPFSQAVNKYSNKVSRGQICHIRYSKSSWQHI
jgi:hypothetical protein